MSGRPLVIITTRLPPAACGIGTYSYLLREHWPDRSAAVEFLVMDGGADSGTLANRDRVAEFSGDPTKLELEFERIGAADVVLHYAARAYQRFGCPVWLPGVLARWKQKQPSGRVLMIVHELPGRLPITTRHFWLGKVDAWIVRRLSSLADVLVTNTQHHADTLHRISGGRDVHLLPVGSNIAVTSEPTARAATEFVLFGLAFGRLLTLQKFDLDVRRWHASGRLTKLHVIGPEGDESTQKADALMAAWPRSIAVVRHGMLPADQVSLLLQRARFALTNVTPGTWSKSGAFMACAAHRSAVVVATAESASIPFSYSIRRAEVETISDAEIDRRTAALAEWYYENADWPVIANRMAALWQNEGLARVG